MSSRKPVPGTVLLALLLLGAAGLFWSSDQQPPTALAASEEDRAVAIGLLLDTPRSPEVLDEALVLAEQLRRHYGIQTGNDYADRQTAAARAQDEFLERLVFSEEEIRATSRELGYDPGACANWCDNLRELAVIELQKRALKALVAGEAWPGRLE